MFIPETGRVYNEKIYWGIMGSNYSKNVTYRDSTLSRFDAHAGVYNFKIIGCEIAQIKITGGGLGIIEDCIIHNNIVATMREDYGTYWRGDLIIKDVILKNDNSSVVLLQGNVHDVHVHDAEMGFKTQMPNVYVENLWIEDYESTRKSDVGLTVFNIIADESMFFTGKGECNEILPAQNITIKNSDDYSSVKVGDEDFGYKLALDVKYE
jgi:hypothetical protein